MPVGNCRSCDRFFVLPQVGSAARRCPRCRQPLQTATTAEALSHLRRPARTRVPVTVSQLQIRAREEGPADGLSRERRRLAEHRLR
jgi:phage FluMu protein Com